MSERLWNAAYDSLETDNAELVMSYMKTLQTVLRTNTGVAPDTNISAEIHNPTKRQTYIRRLVEEGQAKISRASNITNKVGDVAGFVLLAKGIIDLAVQNVLQAALPCFAGAVRPYPSHFNFPHSFSECEMAVL